MNEKKLPKIKKILCYFLFVIPFVLALILSQIAKTNPDYVENFHIKYVFRTLITIFGTISSFFSFSIAETLIFLAIPLLIILIIYIKNHKSKQFFLKFLNRIAWIASSGFLIYTLMHGMNFYRYDVTTLMNFDKSASYSKEQLFNVTVDLAKKSTELRKSIKIDENSDVIFQTSTYDILNNSQKYIDNAKEKYAFLSLSNTRPKGVLLSNLWSYTGITGMYMPLTGESYINLDVPKWTIPHTICHEIVHTNGIARENEANFLGYIVGINSDNIDFEYSATLFAYTQCTNALHSFDSELWQQAYSYLSDDVWNDLNQNNDYWASHEGQVMESSSTINDNFLKSQGQSDGVISYDKSVPLILAYYDSLNFFE